MEKSSNNEEITSLNASENIKTMPYDDSKYLNMEQLAQVQQEKTKKDTGIQTKKRDILVGTEKTSNSNRKLQLLVK